MTLKNYFLHQLEAEKETTRKMLSLVPEDDYQWQPHRKSMTIITLATHIAEMCDLIPITLNTNELDFAAFDHTPTVVANNAQLLAIFERSIADAQDALQATSEDVYQDLWTMRSGEQIYITTNKADMLRLCLSQIIHHRAQLGVFLRLLNIPIPGSYGPSADEMGAFEEQTAEVN